MTARSRRAGAVAVAASAALGLAACGGTSSGSRAVANVPTTSATNGGGTATTAPRTNAARSLVEWATCMRSHGDPHQPDPTIDSHGVINIAIPGSAQSLSNAVHNGTAPCNEYLAAASSALRAGVKDLTPPDQASLVQYAQCMRADGVPNYPDPSTTGRTNLNGIDLNSALFMRANDICGKEIHAPSWWISGVGPPGDISVQSGPMCGNSVCIPSDHGNIPRRSPPTTGG